MNYYDDKLTTFEFRMLNVNKAEEDAENQAILYNTATKNLPGPNSANATKESILFRQKMDYFDPSGTIYAIDKKSGEFISYCQSIQVTEAIIRIGYPWSLPGTPEEIKKRLLSQLFDYYKTKYPDRTLEFEIYTIDERWSNEIFWLQNQGFEIYCYWLWPIYRINEIVFDNPNREYTFVEASENDFALMKTFKNKNDDNLRFKAVPENTLESRFKQMITFSDLHTFLYKKDNLVGFIAVIFSNNKEEPVTITSLLIIEDKNEEDYAKILVGEAIKFTKEKGFTKATSWFKDESLFHKILKPYLKKEVKWYHGIKKINRT